MVDVMRMSQDESSESWIISSMDFMIHHPPGKASNQCPPEQTSVLDMSYAEKKHLLDIFG